jgi:nicotinamidase/pyrazinamidase
VKFSVLDATEMMPGVRVRFVEDASRGITPEGVATAVKEMREHGIDIVTSRQILEG